MNDDSGFLAFEMKKRRMESRDTEKISGLHDSEMDMKVVAEELRIST